MFQKLRFFVVVLLIASTAVAAAKSSAPAQNAEHLWYCDFNPDPDRIYC